MGDELDVAALRQRARGRRGVLGEFDEVPRTVAERVEPDGTGTHVQPGTVPDVGWMWQLAQRVVALGQADALARPLWRITRHDWAWIAAESGTDVASLRLFGVDVEVVKDGRHRWPELVLVVDRRNAGDAGLV
jgi:hypothetical protein